MTSTFANSFFEVLTNEECIDYLRREEVGRIAWVADGGLTLVPVNYAWDGEAIVVRSDAGLKLSQLLDSDVAFEIDRLDPIRKEGWSVVVRGVAREVTPEDWPGAGIKPHDLYLDPWAPGAKLHWVRLVPQLMSGRRIHRVSEVEANPFWLLSTYSFPVHSRSPR
jgi:nitroimidazol reductase NimA-like FMN-containing flavoprotein (pyridoxamine 5'-phosphate oxidase superfamily)